MGRTTHSKTSLVRLAPFIAHWAQSPSRAWDGVDAEACPCLQLDSTAVIDIQEAPARRGVLIVDDDPDLRVTLGELLGMSGICPVFEAGSLADVSNLVPEVLRVNLALVDVNLGQGEPSGLDVHAWLVAHQFRGHVVFMTGHARTHALVRRACAIDGVGVLRKPIDPRVLEGLALQNGGQ